MTKKFFWKVTKLNIAFTKAVDSNNEDVPEDGD